MKPIPGSDRDESGNLEKGSHTMLTSNDTHTTLIGKGRFECIVFQFENNSGYFDRSPTMR